ncbi:MAG: lysyl oxidase family protein [Actinomycetota bacterium]
MRLRSPRRSWLAALLAGTLALSLESVSPAAGGDLTELLPNIAAQPAFSLDVVNSNGTRYLRFSTSTPNIGTGPLEMVPRKNDCDGDGDRKNDRSAMQWTFLDVDADGVFDRGIDVQWEKRLAGCFFFHAAHNHWHFEDFANYRLTRLSDGKAVATRTKVGFCMLDSLRTHPELPGSPSSRYYDSCQPTVHQGISVGWEDLYSAQLEGQNFDIDGVADGKYCVRINIDPNNHLEETSDDDNRSTKAVRLVGMSVTPLSRTC